MSKLKSKLLKRALLFSGATVAIASIPLVVTSCSTDESANDYAIYNTNSKYTVVTGETETSVDGQNNTTITNHSYMYFAGVILLRSSSEDENGKTVWTYWDLSSYTTADDLTTVKEILGTSSGAYSSWVQDSTENIPTDDSTTTVTETTYSLKIKDSEIYSNFFALINNTQDTSDSSKSGNSFVNYDPTATTETSGNVDLDDSDINYNIVDGDKWTITAYIKSTLTTTYTDSESSTATSSDAYSYSFWLEIEGDYNSETVKDDSTNDPDKKIETTTTTVDNWHYYFYLVNNADELNSLITPSTTTDDGSTD